ncbi:EAL domain-containing protein [Thiohalorhabdus sp. Cl-TMA]|uniref:EAL domain-containing protein n=1 Tax=Thiohalorhabdus methylotrophus TaxID=3242694 RepID=A0ABV4TYJ2_9GAMM
MEEHAETDPPELDPATLLQVVEHRSFGVVYQPLVAVGSGEVHGFEALARFRSREGADLPPNGVFRALHDNPLLLLQVETAVKALQVAHAPPGAKLFVNLDPDALLAAGQPDASHPVLAQLVGRAGLVVEIIENAKLSDARASLAMAEILRTHGAELALDDIGADHAMLAFPVLVGVDYLKLDRTWLRRRQPEFDTLLRKLLEFARETGKRTVLEGVETVADLERARHLGIDYAQGFLFRDRFREVVPHTGRRSARYAT